MSEQNHFFYQHGGINDFFQKLITSIYDFFKHFNFKLRLNNKVNNNLST
jgi:hypothetical protein